jgi:SAM-dependent methyltransferase
LNPFAAQNAIANSVESGRVREQYFDGRGDRMPLFCHHVRQTHMSSESPPPARPASYSDRFQVPAAVAAYEAEEYGAGSYATFIWNLQRPVLEKIVTDFRQAQAGPVRLLDFACGTGRVLASLESLVDAAEGVDISGNMVEIARQKCRAARLHTGDILAAPELLAGKFAVITCFRFLLNAEPELRRRVLKKLRDRLREPDGLLVVNVHGNARSLRHPAIVWRRWRERTRPTGAMLNELSPEVTKRLLRESGFEIVRQYGFGMLPPTFYRTPLRRVAATLDACCAGDNGWRDRSIDLLFVCRPGGK